MQTPILLRELLPLLITVGIVGSVLAALHLWMRRYPAANSDAQMPRQLSIVGAWVLALLVCTIALPVSETTRGQILSLAGLITTALIALSSTTLVANAMAGVLLRIVNSFQPGDYIRVGEHFGRVSERDLFHTQIQTEDRDLMTLPNMHLITNPVTVVHETGTIISASVSLGYDIHHLRVEHLLKRAALNAELKDPFVQVRELGDFSIVYRVNGRLEDVNSLITVRSRLRACMLDVLHDDGIEIVSPGFINQRPQADGKAAIPDPFVQRGPAEQHKAEDIVFDKAEEASQKAQRELRIAEIRDALNTLDKNKEEPEKSAARDALTRELAQLQQEEQAKPEEKA